MEGLHKLYDSSDTLNCSTPEEAQVTFSFFESALYEYRLNLFGCLLPCDQVLYEMDYSYFHQNSDLVVENGVKSNDFLPEIIISLFYKTPLVEERVETVVYDTINLLSAAGGNLGLFLGFSCLSILLYCHDMIMKKFSLI